MRMELPFATLDPAVLARDDWAVETASAGQTHMLGMQLAPHLEAGDVLALYGTLGAGKTAFTTGVCAALGVPEASVTSPTFALVQEYDAEAGPIYHIDAYRIERIDEFFELGFETYLFGEGLCIIEWPDRVESVLPAHTKRFRFTHLGTDQRRIERVVI